MEIPERAGYAPSARWRQQGAVHRGRVCGVAGHADLHLRSRRHRCGRAGAIAGLRPAAAWRRFAAASADCRSLAVLLAGVYLAQDGRLLSRCGRDEGSKADRDAARHTAYSDRRRARRRDRVPARPGTLPGRGAGSRRQSLAVGTHGRSAAGRRRRAGRQYAAARPPLPVGMIVTSGSGMESEP